MPTIRLPLSIEQFHQLPRHPAYKYEYIAGQALLTPRGKHYHATLELRSIDAPSEVTLRRARSDDFARLVPLFSAAFHSIQPYGSLDEPTRRQAAEEALERTRSGGDGPWIEQASFVAEKEGKAVGAIFVTLLPQGDLSDWGTYHWTEAPPLDAVAQRLGNPHLTWIFIAPLLAGQGAGTVLLAAAVRELLAMGFTRLVSTFMLGNESSMLWHWRNGFRLLEHPGSIRRMKAQMKERWGNK